MSMIRKMISALGDERNTPDFLTAIYQQERDWIFNTIELQKEEQQAKELQNFFKSIKAKQAQYREANRWFKSSKNPNRDKEEGILEGLKSLSVHNDYENMINYLETINPRLFKNLDFVLGSRNTYTQGQYLENAISHSLKRLLETGDTTKLPSLKFKVGQEQATAEGLIDELAKPQLETMFNFMQALADKYTKRAGQELELYKQGKIDNMGLMGDLDTWKLFFSTTSTIQVSSRLIEALHNATFSAKNYISENDLAFGHTNPFKVLATFVKGGSSLIRRFSRMLACMRQHDMKHPNVPTLFYRIRAIYEIAGGGQSYRKQSIGLNINGMRAKFLIWNNPHNETLVVIPTRKILYELIDTIETADVEVALFGTVKVSQKKISMMAPT